MIGAEGGDDGGGVITAILFAKVAVRFAYVGGLPTDRQDLYVIRIKEIGFKIGLILN